MVNKRSTSEDEEESTQRKSRKNDQDKSNKETRDEERKSTEDKKEELDENEDNKTTSKNRRRLEFEDIYLNNLPCSETYEKSYMHKENITHVISASKTDFIITGKFKI